ncbi:hypothetical protein BTZ20_4065 [Rhodococcus sp. MTM3W5.2]|nr:hypothetical protein BTZ20_4065 [Rhodococcus sp. MTM3W5.2]
MAMAVKRSRPDIDAPETPNAPLSGSGAFDQVRVFTSWSRASWSRASTSPT